jgi:hypothetical protein
MDDARTICTTQKTGEDGVKIMRKMRKMRIERTKKETSNIPPPSASALATQMLVLAP